MSDRKNDAPDFDPALDPNAQPSLMGDVRVPFEPTNKLRWVKRYAVGGLTPSGAKYVLQQLWARAVSSTTLALKRARGDARPTVHQVWIDVPRGEE
jgi:hypothetical protein